MGQLTSNGLFYRPSTLARGPGERDAFNAALEAADLAIAPSLSRLSRLDFSTPTSRSPSNNTGYLFGAPVGQMVTSPAGNRRLFLSQNCRLIAAIAYFTQAYSGVGNETSSLSVRRLSDARLSLLSSDVVNNAAFTSVHGSNLNYSFSANDEIELYWLTPTWAVLPTSVIIWGSLFFALPSS